MNMDLKTLDFVASTDEPKMFSIPTPNCWDDGAQTFQFKWTKS